MKQLKLITSAGPALPNRGNVTPSKAVIHPVVVDFLGLTISVGSIQQFQDSMRGFSSPNRRILIKKGFPPQLVPVFARDLLVSQDEIEAAIGLPKTTRKRYQDNQLLMNEVQSERLMRIAEIETLATEAFGSKEKAGHWMSSRLNTLSGESPLQYLDTEEGAMHIRRTLSAIVHGGGF